MPVRQAVLEDPTYTLAEFRVVMYLASRPPGWKVHAGQIAAALQLTITATERALTGLRKRGDIRPGKVIRDAGGQYERRPSELERARIVQAPDLRKPGVPAGQTTPPETEHVVPPAETRKTAGRNHTLSFRGDVVNTDDYLQVADTPVKDLECLRERRPLADATRRDDKQDHLWSDASGNDRTEDAVKITAKAAYDCLKIIPSRQVTRYLMRTLARSGRRPITDLDAYARAAFTRDPAKWRQLAVEAGDNNGHVPDVSGSAEMLAAADYGLASEWPLSDGVIDFRDFPSQ